MYLAHEFNGKLYFSYDSVLPPGLDLFLDLYASRNKEFNEDGIL